MPAETEAAELRRLQRRAYGRDGVVTAAELRRLHELEDAQRAATAAATPMPPSPAPEEHSAREESPGQGQSGAAGETSDEEEPGIDHDAEPPSDEGIPRAPEPFFRTLRRHPVAVPVLSALMLAVGVAIGWALFAPSSGEVALTAAQQERRDVLAASDYDPGSVRPLARDADALAWYATKDDARLRCLILDVGDQSQSDCRPVDDVRRDLSVWFPVPRGEKGDAARELDGVSAGLLLSTDGEPIVTLQRWPMSSSTSQFAGAERARAEELADEGFASSLDIAGSFRTSPVWIGDRVSDLGAVEKCLIVDAVGVMTCAAPTAAVDSGLQTRVDRVDGANGVLLGTSTLEVRFTKWRTPYLVITEAPPGEGGTGEIVRVEAPPGDPIVVEPPGGDRDE